MGVKYLAMFYFQFTYRGIEQNLIRAGCAVNCSHIDYKRKFYTLFHYFMFLLASQLKSKTYNIAHYFISFFISSLYPILISPFPSEYMCSGVGEKVFDKCDFTMCRGDKCNTATLLTYNWIILPLASLLLLVYS